MGPHFVLACVNRGRISSGQTTESIHFSIGGKLNLGQIEFWKKTHPFPDVQLNIWNDQSLSRLCLN